MSLNEAVVNLLFTNPGVPTSDSNPSGKGKNLDFRVAFFASEKLFV